MVRRWVIELSRAATHLPALATKWVRSAHAETMAIFLIIVLKPLQRLPLRTRHAARGLERRNDGHIGFHFGDDCYFPFFSNLALGLPVNVAQISHNNVWPPSQPPPAIFNARLEQVSFRNISGREPTHDRN